MTTRQEMRDDLEDSQKHINHLAQALESAERRCVALTEALEAMLFELDTPNTYPEESQLERCIKQAKKVIAEAAG